MSRLPKSWGLKTSKRHDGKLDIIGKDDLGKEYRVRTTNTPGVTDSDLRELAAVDRERTTAREFVSGVVANQKRIDSERESKLEDDYAAIAEDIVGQCTFDGRATRPGMIDLPLKCGMSNAYTKGRRYWRSQLAGCTDPVRRREILDALEN